MILRTLLILAFLIACTNSVFSQTSDTSVSTTKNTNINSPIVYVKFCVDTNGKITNVFVSKIKCRNCTKKEKESYKSEAIRVLSSSPDWKPAKEKVYFTVPIKFDLTD